MFPAVKTWRGTLEESFFDRKAPLRPDSLLLNLDRMYRRVRKVLQGASKIDTLTESQSTPRFANLPKTLHYFKPKQARVQKSTPALRRVPELWIFKKTRKRRIQLQDVNLQRQLDRIEKELT